MSYIYMSYTTIKLSSVRHIGLIWRLRCLIDYYKCHLPVFPLPQGADQPHLLMEKLVSAMLHAENKGTLTLDDKMKSWRVSRILHTVGQVANNHIAFLDLNVYSELGRRKEIQQNTRQSTSSETPSVNSNPRASKLQSASRSIRNNQSYVSDIFVILM